ncbi:lantibiotic dehydratase [Nonomuraea sp. KM90]|uniref:lantibiotic dehydratase n=1 Tax=Nonomuraea sp. KM90 TaxID=3457428 RepID=UPI003FCD719F
MSEQQRFAAGAVAMLRMPAAPVARAADVPTELVDAGDEAGGAFLEKVLRDPSLREALEISSESLAGTFNRIEESMPVGAAKRRRLVMATARYLLRMTGRPTPFGLLAGVAMATFGDKTKVRVGSAHAKGVRPDAGWLAMLLADWERQPDVRRQLRVVANDLCIVRGDRLVLPYVRRGGQESELVKIAKEVSVRYTEPVRLVMEWAARPVSYTELLDRLATAFPRAPADAIEAMTGQLVEYEMLLTDLRPPLSGDPLAYVLDRVAAVEGLAEMAELREISAALTRYAERPPGEGRLAWRAAVGAMRALRPTNKSPIHVDLRFDIDVTLPRSVADEAAAAATTLLRISAPATDPTHLQRYHEKFLDRYGTHQLVPFNETVDSERGLGYPAGYQVPVTDHRAEPDAERRRPRDMLLAELAARALLSGSGEVVLNDELVGQLAGDEGNLRPPPESAELCVQVLAESAADLDEGRFRLMVAPMTGSSAAGSIFGRFAYLFPEGSYPMAPLPTGAGGDGPVRTQLIFQPIDPRVANVVQVPMVCDHTLVVGAFAERSDPHVLSTNDLLMGADDHRLFLVSAPHGREIMTVSPHMLKLARQSANAVRLISEISDSGRHRLYGWSWGAAELLPCLPRVRYRRTVFAPARWRVDARLRDRGLGDDEWSAALDAWRAEWRVPDRVQVTIADYRVELDLAVPLHRQLLRHELARHPDTVVCEPPGTAAETQWLDGHANEIVIPLTITGGTDRAVARPTHSDRALRPRHLPGGEWLYAKLYSARDRQNEILGRHLPDLLANLPASVDRWFFIRYADPDPHLRLRFHGDPVDLHKHLLSRMRDWAGTLTSAGSVARFVLDAYEPEVARYGGAEAIEAAERAFAADSAAVLAQLNLCERGLLIDAELLTTANYVDILRGLGDSDWQNWLLSRMPRGDHHAAFQSIRREAIRLIDTDGDWPALATEAGGPELLEIWKSRRPAVAAYGQVVRRLTADKRLSSSRLAVVRGLLHVHHNRFIGIQPTTESRTLAIARGVVEAGLSRKRFLA